MGRLDCHRRRRWPIGAYFTLKTFLYASFSWIGAYSRVVIHNISGGTQNLRSVPLQIKELEPSKKTNFFVHASFQNLIHTRGAPHQDTSKNISLSAGRSKT